VQHDFGDDYWAGRADYYEITAMPTVAGDGVQDVWPVSWLEDDYQAHRLVDSPIAISLEENGPGDFTATIVAEEDVPDARLCLAATLDEHVAASGGGQSHLPYHVVHMMTATGGDAFSIAAGETARVNKPFTVQQEWDYESMGVACWVQVAGGVSASPCPFVDLPATSRVLQCAFVPAGATSIDDHPHAASLSFLAPSPNPSRRESRMCFSTLRAGHARLVVYDLTGREVATVFEGPVSEGKHAAVWDGIDAAGEVCGAGVYFARLVFDGREWTHRKLVRLR